MGSDSKFMRDSNGDVAVRVVTQTEALPAYDPDWMFARDENGNIAVRVVVSEGGGGGSVDYTKVVSKTKTMPVAGADNAKTDTSKVAHPMLDWLYNYIINLTNEEE